VQAHDSSIDTRRPRAADVLGVIIERAIVGTIRARRCFVMREGDGCEMYIL
jgi:hypothetical protein